MRGIRFIQLPIIVGSAVSLGGCANSFSDALANFFPSGVTASDYVAAASQGVAQGQYNAQNGYVTGSPQADAAWRAANDPMLEEARRRAVIEMNAHSGSADAGTGGGGSSSNSSSSASGSGESSSEGYLVVDDGSAEQAREAEQAVALQAEQDAAVARREAEDAARASAQAAEDARLKAENDARDAANNSNVPEYCRKGYVPPEGATAVCK